MKNANDTRILTLREKIEEKKKWLEKNKCEFKPRTTCIIEYEGQKYNIRVNDVTLLYFKLNLLNDCVAKYKSNIGMSDDDTLRICGFPISDWIYDIEAKIQCDNYKVEKKKLELLDGKLKKLLTEETQTELAIDDIESLLN